MAEKTYGPNLSPSKGPLDGYLEYKSVEEKKKNLLLADIAQSRYFTILIDRIRFNGKPIQFKLATPRKEEYTGRVPVHVFEDFFPVKNISVNFSSYENLSIPFAIFGDLPILHRKRLARININAYDMDDDRVEYALQQWERLCFPESKYVAYLDEIASKFEYMSYDVTGRPNYSRTYSVILADNIQISRDYESNNEKIVSFSLVAVGEPGASAEGSYGGPTWIREGDTLSTGSNNSVPNKNSSMLYEFPQTFYTRTVLPPFDSQ